ncbi:hypothetical protein PT974_09121 [Cladobotryum mycophilum]|uniref:Uncharacterized protein n=1 Tax=Cladobotryum mycophilum TaxID=491253 RepID=A0ABR0SGN7_9HYPO
MSDKQEVTQTENGAYEVRSQKRGCIGVLKRFWWAFLLALICVIVLVVCLIIFVGVPNIAQKKVNEAKLEVQGVNMLFTTPDTFKLEINSTISTDGKIKANIDPFLGVMYLTDAGDKKPFLNINFPATNANKHQIVNISEEVTIPDHDSFNRFNVWFFNNETLKVTIEGKTKVQPSGLDRKYDVTFKKTIEMKGLNAFKGTTVTEGEILIKPVNGANFKAVSHIPNPSYFTLDIGNTTFANSIDGTPIGTLWINELIVRPGINSYPVTANLDQVKVYTIASSSKYCNSENVPVTLAGTAVSNNGQGLNYYQAALGSAKQVVPMDIRNIIKQSLNTTISCPTS